MRVLVTTTGGTGHVLPTVPVAEAMQRAGHEVVWATAPAACATVERLGFRSLEAGVPLDRRAAMTRDLHPELMTLAPRDRRPVMFSALFAEVAGPMMAADLEAVLDDVAPDLVVHEIAELAAPAVASARGIPHVTVAFSGVLPEPVRAAAVVAAAPLWEQVGLEVPEDLGLYDDLYLHPFAPMLGQRPGHDVVVDLRPENPDGETGPELPAWLARLGDDRPLVYVTYGTEMGPLAPWAAFVEGLAAMEVDVLVTTGGSVDPAAVAVHVPPAATDRIRIERYVRQAWVVPRAAVVISHGGAGTLIAAGAAGVPQLVVPAGADQFDNADAFSGVGAALVVDDGPPDAATVSELVRRLLEEPEIVAAADRLAAEFATMPHADAAVGRLREE